MNENSITFSSISSNKQIIPDFKFSLPLNDYQDDDYEKILEKEIENQCHFNVYVDKLELKDKTDTELLLLSKEEILQFKNDQIIDLKAYIISLEQEKEDLINNFKDTTNLLIEKIKENEFQSKGIRPETPMIAKSLNKKNGGGVKQSDFKSLQSSISNSNSINNTNLKPQSKPKTIIAKQRCPNCSLEFPEEQFITHSLECLRKTFHCKKCGELVNEKDKKEHLIKYRSIQAMIKSIESNDAKLFELGFEHGFKINTILNNTKEETAIHFIARNDRIALIDIYLKQKDSNINQVNKSNETPLMIALDNKHESFAMVLLTKGADFKMRNNSDISPLMLGCKYGFVTLVKRLISLGADINEKNIIGDTPLKIAQMNNNEDLAMILIKEFNANIRQKNKIHY